MLQLDHIAVLGETLDEAAAHLEAAAGPSLLAGGSHTHFGTHNRLLGLGLELYIEAIATDPEAAPLPYARWFGLDDFSGPARLDKWICRVADMDAALQALPMAGRKVDLVRGDLRWTMAVPEDGLLPYDGMFPALIQWHSAHIPGRVLPAGDRVLQKLTVSHPQAAELQALLAPHLAEPCLAFVTGEPALTAQIRTGRGDVELA